MTGTRSGLTRRCGIGALAAVGLVFVAGGCNDELKAREAQIALIEDANERLTQELAQTRDELDQVALERERCNDGLAACRGEVDTLMARLNERPEPTPPDGWQAVPGGAMIAVEGSVLFTPGKAALRDSGRSTLEMITSTIRGQYADKDVFVFGHTDDTPIRKSGWKDNFELSTQRALTVTRYLRDQGIDARRLVACGAGEFRPRVPNSNESNRAQNRRVEIFAVTPTLVSR